MFAHRHVIRVVRAVVLLLQAPDAPVVDLIGDKIAAMSKNELRKQVVAALVGVIVLCIVDSLTHGNLISFTAGSS